MHRFTREQPRDLTSPWAPGIEMCGIGAYGEVHYWTDGYYRCRCGKIARTYPFHDEPSEPATPAKQD